MDNTKTGVEQNKNLINPKKSAGQLMQIECSKCGNIDKPQKWQERWIFGVLFLFTILNVFGILLYFMFTNPYICKKCGERNKLIKILNDNRRIPISCMSKNNFLGVSIVLLVISFLILVKFRM